MLFELILLLVLGLVFIYLGLLIWKKKKLDLIHSYHRDRVSEENVDIYAAIMGKGMLLIGTGMILAGTIDYLTGTALGWIAFAIGFIAGLALFIHAGCKYNR